MANTLIKLADFTPAELRAWQKRLLEILVYFSDFCQKHQLKFYLAYGTLLGAIRHKGFIPWDDDVDVQMPREDFEKLYDFVKEIKFDKDNYFIISRDKLEYTFFLELGGKLGNFIVADINRKNFKNET